MLGDFGTSLRSWDCFSSGRWSLNPLVGWVSRVVRPAKRSFQPKVFRHVCRIKTLGPNHRKLGRGSFTGLEHVEAIELATNTRCPTLQSGHSGKGSGNGNAGCSGAALGKDCGGATASKVRAFAARQFLGHGVCRSSWCLFFRSFLVVWGASPRTCGSARNPRSLRRAPTAFAHNESHTG